MDISDEAATFIREQFPVLVGLLGLYCGDRTVAEELAQEALERACRDWSRVRQKDSPEAWTRRVAINLANSYFRRRAAERRATSRLQSGVVAPSDSDQAGALAMRQAVVALPPRQRTVVILHYYLDMPFSEIADLMRIPLSTSKSLASRGVARLRLIAGLHEEE